MPITPVIMRVLAFFLTANNFPKIRVDKNHIKWYYNTVGGDDVEGKKVMSIRIPMELAKQIRDLSYLTGKTQNQIIIETLQKRVPEWCEKEAHKFLEV